MKKAIALLAAMAVLVSVSSHSIQTIFADSSEPTELPPFIGGLGEITPDGEPEPISEESEESEESQPEHSSWQWHDDYTSNIMESHGYFDNRVIDYVGIENYETWVQAHLNTPEGADVYLFFEDFGITPEILKEIVHESIYEEYMEYWPVNTGR